MPIRIHHDKETYSEADLTEIGAYKYAADLTTDCLLTSGTVEDGPIRRWRPGDKFPYRDVKTSEIEIHAWNSQFERLIWRDIMTPIYGWPHLDLEQFVCVSAQARNCASGPAKLETAAHFFQRRHKKDMKGHLHMLKMCRPATDAQQAEFMRRGGSPQDAKCCHHTRENLDRLHDYCDPDVLAERDISHMLPEWRAVDLEDFWLNERINDRGIVVDTGFAAAATAYAEDEKAYFAERIAGITRNRVQTPRQFDKIKKWFLDQVGEESEAWHMCKWYDNGEEKYSLDADTRANLLAEQAIDATFLPDDVAEFIEVLDMAGKSTIAKYQAIVNRAQTGLTDSNTRVHGCYMFAGAAQSGRYSSTGIQVHNLVRDVPDEAVKLIKAFKRDENVRPLVKEWVTALNVKQKRMGKAMTPPEPIHALATLTRPTITGCPNGDFDLVWSDWSAIEARALPWLANDPRADDLLAIFRKGGDVYLKTASDITGRKITKEDEFERQAFGKVPILSLGYGGWVGAFLAMAKNYGVHLEEKTVLRICGGWRETNEWAAHKENGFWAKLAAAAMHAMNYEGKSFGAGRVHYRYDREALDGIGALFCALPSGRELCYPSARIEVKRKFRKDAAVITAMKGAWRPKKGVKDWPRIDLWHGLFAENDTQAICADLLRLALRRCEREGMDVSAHTHDEIMIETANPEDDAKRLVTLMRRMPPWPGSDALPLHAEAGYGYRYKVKEAA